MATITFTNQTVQNFVTDLDENIVFKELQQSGDYGEIFMDFINPVTGSVDQVQFEMCKHYETLHRIFYVIDSSKAKIHEELEMENLNDLYDFVLIDEEE